MQLQSNRVLCYDSKPFSQTPPNDRALIGETALEPLRRAYGHRSWVWCVVLAALLSSCSAAHQYHYDYALKASGERAAGVIEDDQVRAQVVPTETPGVVQLAVINKSLEPVAVAWRESYFVNPHGHRHQAVNTDQGIIRAPDASMREGAIAPGATWRGTVQPGGVPTTRPRPAEIDQGGLSPVDRQLVLNPLTVTLYEGGEAALGSPASSFLPNTGNTPALAEAYKGQEFHLVLGLQTGDDVTPYRFTFVITDVRVR